MNHLTRRNGILIITSRGNVQINTKEKQKSNLYKALLVNETIDKLYTRYNAITIQVDGPSKTKVTQELKGSSKDSNIRQHSFRFYL